MRVKINNICAPNAPTKLRSMRSNKHPRVPVCEIKRQACPVMAPTRAQRVASTVRQHFARQLVRRHQCRTPASSATTTTGQPAPCPVQFDATRLAVASRRWPTHTTARHHQRRPLAALTEQQAKGIHCTHKQGDNPLTQHVQSRVLINLSPAALFIQSTYIYLAHSRINLRPYKWVEWPKPLKALSASSFVRKSTKAKPLCWPSIFLGRRTKFNSP